MTHSIPTIDTPSQVTPGTILHSVAVSWDDALAGNFPEPRVRRVFRMAVAEIAEKAKVALPDCVGRIDAAVKIVLAGDVDSLEGGKAKVASQSDGTTTYHIVNGTCDCRDFPQAPNGFCKHRLAAAIHQRASDLAKHRLEAEHNGQAPEPPRLPSSLPEAPASVNVYVEIEGRKVQVTLRDSDEDRLLKRLAALLQRYPAAADTGKDQEPPEGWCAKHQVQMKLNRNEKGTWWSHKTADGSWCRGK